MSEVKHGSDRSADSIWQDGPAEPDRQNAAATPHWEHGYRCHGYWLRLERLGSVGLPPRGFGRVYTWRVGNLYGEYRTLRAAKRQVERIVNAQGQRGGK